MSEILSASLVHALLRRVLFTNDELVDGKAPDGAVIVQGLVRTFGFHPGRIAESKPEIDALLGLLPDQFQKSKGGGWSFLNACMDRDGRHWGEHSDVEALVCLGVGAGSASFQMPRDMWDVLPGGMPYFEVHPS